MSSSIKSPQRNRSIIDQSSRVQSAVTEEFEQSQNSFQDEHGGETDHFESNDGAYFNQVEESSASLFSMKNLMILAIIIAVISLACWLVYSYILPEDKSEDPDKKKQLAAQLVVNSQHNQVGQTEELKKETKLTQLEPSRKNPTSLTSPGPNGQKQPSTSQSQVAPPAVIVSNQKQPSQAGKTTAPVIPKPTTTSKLENPPKKSRSKLWIAGGVVATSVVVVWGLSSFGYLPADLGTNFTGSIMSSWPFQQE